MRTPPQRTAPIDPNQEMPRCDDYANSGIIEHLTEAFARMQEEGIVRTISDDINCRLMLPVDTGRLRASVKPRYAVFVDNGAVPKRPPDDILTIHRKVVLSTERQFICLHCGRIRSYGDTCPGCGSSEVR